MIQAFNSHADFTGISANSGSQMTVLHKTFIEFCESGTEAAAATAIVFFATASPSGHKTPEPKLFTADRPFIFLIQEKSSGTILFMGKMMNPVE